MSGMSPPATLDIAHVVENLERGGLERMVIDLVSAQHRAGHRCRVACLFEPGALAGELAVQGIEVFACGKRGGIDVSALRRLRRWLRQSPRSVVHTHNATAHYHVALASMGLSHARLINTRHGMGAARPGSRLEWLYRRAMPRTDAVAAVCEAARARFAAQGVHPRGGLYALPNGIRVERFSAASDESRQQLIKTLDLPADARIIGSVGRLNPVKDQAAMINALQRLHGEIPNAVLVIVGDGPLRDALQQQATAQGIADAVRLLGDRSDVEQLLPGFDVFVLSSRSEGYSMALLEACASALPIIATDVGGNREIVVDGHNGMMVPAGDLVRMAEALQQLLVDPQRATSMGHAGRDWALKHASLQAMADRYDALYRGVAFAAADDQRSSNSLQTI